jgi:hypothetical protein
MTDWLLEQGDTGPTATVELPEFQGLGGQVQLLYFPDDDSWYVSLVLTRADETHTVVTRLPREVRP